MMLTIPITKGRYFRVEVKARRRYGFSGRDGKGELIKSLSGVHIETFIGILYGWPELPAITEE